MKSNGVRLYYLLAGVIFALLWASASAATKIGLQVAQPFVIALARFAVAGTLMLLISHVFLKHRLPSKQEWRQLLIYGSLNIAVYLGLYVVAMREVSAGLGALFPAISPVFVALISAILYRQKVHSSTYISLFLCLTGICIASYPLLEESYASPRGLLLLLLSMFSYSVGSVYFTQQSWKGLHILTINGWQTILGGVLLLPVMLFSYETTQNRFDEKFYGSVLWLALIVSIIAVQLWLFLIKKDAVTSSFWLFLCPIFGFLIAWLLMYEPIDLYTLLGVLLVIIGLYLALKRR